MGEVRESELPGVGMRYEFTTSGGRRVCVITHRSGRRELAVSDPADPDSFSQVAELNEDETRTLAELLGMSRVAEHLQRLQQKIEGLAIDWLPIDPDSPFGGRTIGDARIRSRTGVSVVAVLREDDAFPAPGPEFTLEAGDYLVVVGTPRGIERVVELLHNG